MKIEAKLTFLTMLLLSCTFFVSAQKLDHVLGDVLIKIDKKQRIETLVEQLQYFNKKPTQIEVVNLTSRPLNIWLLHFDQNTINENHFLEFLRRQDNIEIAQFNHFVTMRQTTPNDSFFSNQWHFVNDGSNGGIADADIDADLAWDITTGGVTTDGDTIVVAILDTGIDIDHEDLVDNLWINHAEIPNDGLDNDNNGYTDDYRGWNTVDDNNNISGSSHGTQVTGIVGAKGNNNIGVTGINWKVKLMVIKNGMDNGIFVTTEDEILEAYSYPLEMRRKYNETDGAEGAFVVSTNASWGKDFSDPEDHPIWCAFYDTLGISGILSCGATINQNVNVDEAGDMPTACPSDYLISVTWTNRSDNKGFQAGYGAETIDLGAPGDDIYTTTNGNGYTYKTGTSFSTPLVTGAIALLYAAPCPNLIALAKADPAAAAILVKDYILNGVDPNSSLDGITTSGGRLNVFNSLNLLMNDCGPCPSALALDATDITDTQALLDWIPGINADSSTLQWRAVASPDWNIVTNADAPYLLIDLDECTEYEFQINAVCPDESSGFTDSYVFETDGCCVPPSDININIISNSSATINWNAVLAADSYTILISSSTGTFTIEGIIQNFLDLTELDECVTYYVSILTVCDGMSTAPSDVEEFLMPGCGACTDLNYCDSEGGNSESEWIETIALNSFVNNSGDDGGYGDYTGSPIELLTFNTYEIILTPGFSNSGAYKEYFKVWIDFNKNGTFEEPGELVFDPGVPTEEMITGNIMIDEFTPLGITRMRIGMRWAGIGGDATPEACSSFSFGEVEDYCVNILSGAPANCDLPYNLDTMNLGSTETFIVWEDHTDDHSDHNLRYKKTSGFGWITINNVSSPYTLNNLEECVEYEVQVEANCISGGTSSYTESLIFFTDCESNVNNIFDLQNIKLYPIPFVDHIVLEFQLRKTTNIHADLISTNGQKVFSAFFGNLGQGSNQITIKNLENVPAGVYFLKLHTSDDQVIVKKIIKY